MGNDIKLKTNDWKNCLHIATLYGHFKLYKSLKDKYYFYVFISDNDRCTALNVSAGRVYFELFNYFIKMGSDIYLKTNNGKIVFILHHAMDI